MPLEFWIMLMTFFNVFLVITYLYYKSLHLKTKSNFEESIEKIETKINYLESYLYDQVYHSKSKSTPVEDDETSED